MDWKSKFFDNLAEVKDQIDTSTYIYLTGCTTLEDIQDTLCSLLENKYNIALDWLYSTLPKREYIDEIVIF